jgi:hypothetical protein
VNHYLESLAKSKASVLYVPLEDNSFNACKSNIAWIEATICGMVCAVNERIYDFDKKIPTMLNFVRQKDRVELVNSSLKLVKKDYILENTNNLRIELLNSLVAERKRI